MNDKLPNSCYAVLPGYPTVVIIIYRGESGFRPAYIPAARVDAVNESFGTTRAQAAAMVAGSMFGWDCPAADPASYDNDGNLKRRQP